MKYLNILSNCQLRNRKGVRILTILPMLFFILTQGAAQDMEVTNAPPITPENLITNIFLGEGVEVISVDYQGPPLSVGFFKNGEDEIGIGRGIILTTGNAVTNGLNIGANSLGSDFASIETQSTASDPDVSQIVGNSDNVNDLVSYTIKFIPISDTLRFNYVFASEEYPEFVCSEFNDVFGFFISGPGISGPFENGGENIALIPGTNLPVTINNVNSGINAGSIENCTPPNGSLAFSQFYNDNDGSNNQPVYDGYTDVFTAQAIVTPCQEYTIKLIIADVSDGSWDSGVFLEAKSFGTGSLKVEAVTVSLDGTVSEGCSEGVLTFKLPSPVLNDFPIDYQILGTAINGVDYELIPPNIFIPAGSDSISIPIIAFEDGIVELPETLLIDVQKDVCNRDTISIIIKDNPTFPPDLGPDVSICPGDSVQLDGTIAVPLPPAPTFTNSTNLDIPSYNIPVFSDIEVSNVVPQRLGPGVIRQICIDSLSHRWIDDLDIYLISPDGQFLELTTDNGGSGGVPELALDWYYQTCFTPTATMPINFPGPFAPDSAVPFTGDFQPEGVWSDLWDGNRNTNGTWRLQLIDDQINLDGILFSWTIIFEPVYQIYYEWSPAEGLSCTDCPDPLAKPTETTTYTLNIIDSYGCTQTDEVTIEVRPTPDAPAINCQSVTESTITIDWADVPDALGYEVSLDGITWVSPSSLLSHTEGGLAFTETLEIFVRSLSDDCLSPSSSISCTTLDCPGATGTIATTGVSCPDADDGQATITITTGVIPFSFELGGEVNTTGIFTGLEPGTHTLQATDNLGCTTPFGFTISAPDSIAAEPIVLDSISCQGESDGRITVDVTSNNGPFTFNWSNSSTDSIITGLSTNTYTVTVTDPNNCTKEFSLVLNEPTLLTLTSEQQNINCNGENTGTATISATGGVSPYQYQWDSNANDQSTAIATLLLAGSYTVSVTDANNCLQTATFDLTEPTALTSTIDSTLNGCGAQPSGTATVTASGGTTPYAYEWDSSPAQTNATATGLTEGIYNVTVTDDNGCIHMNTVEVLAPPMISLSFETTDLTCNGNTTGSIQATASGGTGTLTYSWQEAGLPASDQVDNLSAGVYHLTVSDDLGCTATATIPVSEPSSININAETSAVACFGENSGSIDITAFGGTGNLTYLWNTGSTDEDLDQISAGTYSLTVTDENNCTANRAITISATTSILINFNPTTIECFGEATGSLQTQIQGGSAPYTYNWSHGGNTPNLDNLVADTYQLTLTDAQGCQAIDSIEVTQPEMPLAITLEIDSVSCHGLKDGRIDIIPTGGTPPYSYSRDNNEYNGVSSLLALETGTFDIFVKDARGCLVFESDIEVSEPNPLVLSLGADLTLEYGDITTLTPSIQSDVPIVEYIWTPSIDETLNCLDCPTVEVNTLSQVHIQLDITNESGCKATDILNLFIKKDFSVFVPTGFTPNKDGINDELLVHGHEHTTITTFRIFDRWGELVFERSGFGVNETTGWDGFFNGKLAAAGVYIWSIEAILPDGETDFFDGETSLLN